MNQIEAIAMVLASEEWRPSPVFGHSYEVSSLGRVRRKPGTFRSNSKGVLRPQYGKQGRAAVYLSNGPVVHRKTVHRLVCEAFHGPCPNGMECAHHDGNRANNCASNISWKTHLENEADKLRHGRRPYGMRNGKYTKPERTPRGERHGQAILTEAQALRIRVERHVTRQKMAEMMGISPSTVKAIRCGRLWSHL